MVLLARGSVTVTAVNDGVPEKLYRAWSNNADGSGYSTTDSSGKYLGTYVGLSEPTLASQYKWTLIKGETGQPGVSAYLHTAWANSANGQTGFSTSVSTDKLFIGTYSSSSSTPSQVYTSYKWVRVKGLDAKFYSVIVDKSFLNRNGLSSTATETIAINSYVHEGNSAGVAAPGFFIIKEQIKQTTAGATTYVFQEKHRSTTAVSQLNYTVSANAVTVKIEFYLTNQFNNLFAVRDIGVLMDASTDIEARVPIAQLIENINNHPSTTLISGAKMRFTNEVTFDQSFHTKLFAETGFIEKLGAYEFSADNIKTGTLSSVNGMSTMNLNTGAFSFAGGKLKYDGTTLSVIGSLTVDSFAPALKTSFDGKVDTSKLKTSGQVIIHGGNITAGTLSADKITTGTLDASKVTVDNLNATNITTGTLDVGVLTLKNLSANDIQAGTLDANKVTVKNLNATNITAGTLDVGILNLKNLSADDMQQGTLDANNVSIVNLSASSIKTGTLDASLVNIDKLSANSIKGGSLDLSKGLTISDGVNDILSIGADGKVALRASSINIGILPVATKKDVDDIALTPGPQGTSITSVTEWYLATSAATGVTTSTAGWDKTMRTMTTTNKYLWNYKVINYSQGTPQTTAPVIIGVYGTTGATGRSITSITKNYLATSESSGIVKTDSRFTQTIQSTSPTNKYLWTYETITWNVAPLTTYVDPFIIGTHGEKGEIGITGVGLQSITEWYLATPLKEGVTRTTSGWKESVQTLSSVNNYLWNYEQVNYDNGTKQYTDPTIIGTFGEQGISVKGVTEYYLTSPLSEGITKDTPGWTTDIQPLTPENKYLWNKEIIHYSDDAAFLDKTEILSGTEIFTDKADENSVVHVEIDGESVGVGNNNLLSKGDIENWNVTTTWNGDVSVIETTSTGGLRIHHSLFDMNKEYVLGFKAKLISGTINGIRGHSSSFNTIAYQDDVLLGTWLESVTAVDKPLAVGAISEFKILFNKKAPTDDWLYIQPNRTAYGKPFKVELFDFQINEGSALNKYEGLKPTPSHPIEIHSLNDFDVVSSVGKENLLTLSKKDEETTGAREFVNNSNWDLSPIFDKYGVDINYTISFDIKSKVAGNINVYAQNGSSSRYSIGSYGLSVDTEYKRMSVTVKPTLQVVNEPKSLLAFFGSYDSGRIPTIKNVKVEIGAGSESNDFTPSPLTINSGDKLDGIDKINLLLDEPLRSVVGVKDRLFRDTDGLWKIERKVRETDFKNNSLSKYGGSSYTYGKHTTIQVNISDRKLGMNTSRMSHLLNLGISTQWDNPFSTGYSDHNSMKSIFLYVPNDVLGLASNEAKSIVDIAARAWVERENIEFIYVVETPTIEILSQSLQDKLNNLHTFKNSNYIYTVLPDKNNILSENIKPTLHAMFKSKAWAGNFSGYPSIIGVYGDSAKLLYLSTSADSMTFNSDGSANPASQTITFTGNLQNVLGNVLFTAIAYNGTTVVSTISLSGVGNTRTLTQAQFPASADRVQVKATLGNLEDTVTIVKLKNGADAIVGYLTNESVTLSANNAGTVSSFGSASGTFKVFEGTIDKTSSATFRVKTQTGAVGAIATSGVYTISSMSSDTANIVFEATYKNVKIDQTLSLAKSKEGAKGTTGTDGVAGKDGVGIKTTTISYASSTSGTATPTSSSFTSTVPTVAPGDYLWTRTIWTYTDNSLETGYTVSRIGKDGNTGSNGIAGKDGVGISKTVITYVSSSSGTSIPTSGFVAAVPMVNPGNYLWTKTTWTYTDGSTESGYSAARMGADGARGASGTDGIPGKDGVGIKSTGITYASSTSGTVAPAGSSFVVAVPTVAPGNYLWTRTIWTYTDNSTETGYTVSRIGKDGNTGNNGVAGKDGVGISNTLVEYVGSASGTVKPTTGYTATVPVVNPGNYLWTRTTWTYTDSSKEYGYSAARMGENGAQGPQGVSITKVDVQYYLSTSSTALAGGGWSTTAPDWVDGRFMWSKTVTTYTSGSPSESIPVCITGAKGSTGGTGSTGATGRGVSSVVEQFYLSTSKTAQTGGSWVSTPPAWSTGKYIWTRSLITYTTGTPATSTTEPLVSSEWEAVNELEIGGTNLVDGSPSEWQSRGFIVTDWMQDLTTTIPISSMGLKAGDTITLSIELEAGSRAVSSRIEFFKNNSERNSAGGNTIQNRTGVSSLTATIPADRPYIIIRLQPDVAPVVTAYTIKYRRYKLEKGNKATDWSMSRNDYIKHLQDAQTDGQNYFHKSTNLMALTNMSQLGRDEAQAPNGFTATGGSAGPRSFRLSNVINSNGWWTVSGWYMGSQSVNIHFQMDINDGPQSQAFYTGTANAWQYFEYTAYVSNYSASRNFVDFNVSDWAYYFFKDVIVNKGDKAIPWRPAPEDVQSSIDLKADGTSTEAALNEAAAKLQVLQQEVAAAATADELKDFVAKYNKEQEALNADKATSEKNLSDAMTSIDAITTNMGDMSATWKFVDRSIRNTPQGIVIGNESSGSFIRINEQEIGFFSNGQRVAFVAQNVMQIDKGIFVEEIQVAKYKFDESTTNHLTIRYVG